MITNDVFNFINTDRYSAAAQRGVTFISTIYTYQQCDNKPNNLFGYRPLLTVKENFETEDKIIECSIANGRAEIDAPRGLINFIISAADTQTLPLGMFVYEITLVSADDLVFRLCFGKFQVMG